MIVVIYFGNMKDCNTGFNFAKEEEAEKFYNTVMNKILSKTKKNSTKNTPVVGGPNSTGSIDLSNRPILANQPVNLNLAPQAAAASTNSNSSIFGSLSDFNKFGTVKSSNKDTNKKKKIDKSQISAPTGFKVVQHVGLSSNNNNFEVEILLNLKPKLKTQSELNFKNIYSF